MKSAKKILSVALVLMLALSVMVLPTSAAEPVVKADVVAEYQGRPPAATTTTSSVCIWIQRSHFPHTR